ncbi:unnamed protein product [Clonostachys rosea f. rosea IK726]|uniref:Uncharacterized protein n=1 Tax=Clonostachys rosea f. rosea IK726 TaxID=1349383 RepID=A0ACA9TF46_BIOOC|nr:unnamed protein product [Clonostachys rosea f. rosea IK726]
MPGIPKSKGCKSCKRRKIKCDEQWPTCTPCRRSCSRCPGPSSVFKFVHNGQHSVPNSAMAQNPNLTDQTDNKDQQEGLEMLRRSFPSTTDGSWYGAFRLNGSPRSPRAPTSMDGMSHQRQLSTEYAFPSLAAEIPEDDDVDTSHVHHRLPSLHSITNQDPSRRRDFLLVDPNLFAKNELGEGASKPPEVSVDP